MANYGGYKYFIDEIKSKYNEGFVKFLDDINMNGNNIINVGNPIDTSDALNLGYADIRYGGKGVDNIWSGTNIFNGNTEFGNVVIDNLEVTGMLLFGDIIPNDDDTYNIGSIAKRFRDLRLSNNASVGGNLNVGGTGNFDGIVNFWEKVNFFKDITIFERASFIFNVGDNSYNISYNDKDGVVRKSQHWSHIINNNCEVIGGDIDDRIGNSMLSVIGALATSGDFGVGGDSIFDGDIFAKSDLIFNEGGANDPHIGWADNTLYAYANAFYFKNTAGSQDLMTVNASGLKMIGRNVFDTGHLIPIINNTMDIGSETKGYKNIFNTGSITTPKIINDPTADKLLIRDSTDANTLIEVLDNGIISAPLQSGFRAERATTNQSIPDSSDTTLICNSEIYDIQDEYNTSTGVFTAKTAGKYTFSAGVVWNTNATGNRRILMYKNSTPIAQTDIEAIQNDFYSMLNVSTEINLAVSDTVKIHIYQTSGENLIVVANTRTFFAGHKIA